MGLAVLIDRPGYRIVADRKVLKGHEVGLVQDVARAFGLAQAHLAATLVASKQECAQRAAAGYADGLARAQHEAAQRLTVVELDRLQLLESLRPALSELVVDAIVLLAKGLDRKVIFGQALQVLQNQLRDASWARLRVHPGAVAAAQSALDEFCVETGLPTLARVVADESLPPDGCVFESEFGKVDASLDTQLEVIRAAIQAATYRLVEHGRQASSPTDAAD